MFLQGQKVGKYEILRSLGSGGFGSVFLAKDTWLDIKVAIKVPHKQSVELYKLLKEPRLQAALGARIEVPTFEGNEVLKVPPGVQSGEVFRIKGKGIRDVDGRRKGDLYMKVIVTTPADLTKEQRSLLLKLAELRGETINDVDNSVVLKVRNLFH